MEQSEVEVVRSRDMARGAAVRADRLREVLSARACVRNVVIVNHMNEACPALRSNVRSVALQ